MGFELDKFINDIVTSSTFSSIFNNPIWSSLLIVSIILIIMYFVFQDAFNEESEEEYSFWRLLFRAGIYISIAVFGIIFIHYKNVSYDFEKSNEDKLLSRTVQSTTGINITNPGAPPPIVTTPQMVAVQPTAYLQPAPQVVMQQGTPVVVGQGEPRYTAVSGMFENKPSLVTTKDVILVRGT